ncbi:MAG: hypothetical protein EPO32_03115 [Anaerolineae bacterium]|nr:MAG: hypothetical protein EPO32_03115 [Anaerolineae bacterium]
MTDHEQIRQLLHAFQEGYTHRDPARLEAFMMLFTEDVETIGTNGIRPGQGEWYTDRESSSILVKEDWEFWGDFKLDPERTAIRIYADTAWISAFATVTQTIGDQAYDNYLTAIKSLLDDATLSAEHKLHDILRGASNTLFELHRGSLFIWPLRLTAVAVRGASGWQFAQLHFSFPTTRFPDVRHTDESSLDQS